MERVRFSQALLAAVVGVAAVAASQAQASTVIVADNFSGSGSLAGRAPSTPQHAGDVWSDANGIGSVTTSGTLSVTATAQTASLPCTITTGTVYDLTADVTAISGWTGIGFQSGSGNGDPWHNAMYPWVFTKAAGDPGWGEVTAFGLDSLGAQFVDTYTGVATHHFDIQLDTSGSQWVASLYLDNAATPAGTYTYAAGANPAIDHVGIISAWPGTGTIQNLAVTAVPEPVALSVLGLAGLCGLRRRHA